MCVCVCVIRVVSNSSRADVLSNRSTQMQGQLIRVKRFIRFFTIHRLVSPVALEVFIDEAGRLKRGVKIVLQCLYLLVEYVAEGLHL